MRRHGFKLVYLLFVDIGQQYQQLRKDGLKFFAECHLAVFVVRLGFVGAVDVHLRHLLEAIHHLRIGDRALEVREQSLKSNVKDLKTTKSCDS